PANAACRRPNECSSSALAMEQRPDSQARIPSGRSGRSEAFFDPGRRIQSPGEGRWRASVVLNLLPRSIVAVVLFPTTGLVQEVDPAQTYASGSFQFLSYGRIPTWAGMVSGWQTGHLRVQLYDPAVYRGHADFVAFGLQTGLNFRQFKRKVATPTGREYVPFFLYDLRRARIEVEGRMRSWALRLEDYEYEDTDEGLLAVCQRLFHVVAEQIHPGGNPEAG